MTKRHARIPEDVILKMSGATGAQWAVLAVLYLHANANGQAHPSLKALEALTGLNTRTIRRAIEDLESMIELRRIHPRRGAHVSVTYTLPTVGLQTQCQDSSQGVCPAASVGLQVPKQGACRPPKQRPSNSNEQTPRPRSLRERPGAEEEATMEHPVEGRVCPKCRGQVFPIYHGNKPTVLVDCPTCEEARPVSTLISPQEGVPFNERAERDWSEDA